MTSQNDGIDYQKKYEHLAGKVREMLAAQKAYFAKAKKGHKDFQLLKVSKAIETEVDDIVNPKQPQVSQATIDWLGQ